MAEFSQQEFIKKSSNDLIKFIFHPIIGKNTDKFLRFYIKKEKYKNKIIYKVICQETDYIIMYFKETSCFYTKEKYFSIYLNYNYIDLEEYLILDLENLVNEFVGVNFDKKNIIENGILIGTIETNNRFDNFKLHSILSNSLYIATQKYEEINNYFQKWKNVIHNKLLKKTRINLKNIETNKIITIQNRLPIWDNYRDLYILDFKNLVTQASIKNTILIDDDENELLIFGKIANNLYSLNIKYPLSLIHGICMCITSLNK